MSSSLAEVVVPCFLDWHFFQLISALLLDIGPAGDNAGKSAARDANRDRGVVRNADRDRGGRELLSGAGNCKSQCYRCDSTNTTLTSPRDYSDRPLLPVPFPAFLPLTPASLAASRLSPSAPAAARRCTVQSTLETGLAPFAMATRWRCSTSRTLSALTLTNTRSWQRREQNI